MLKVEQEFLPFFIGNIYGLKPILDPFKTKSYLDDILTDNKFTIDNFDI